VSGQVLFEVLSGVNIGFTASLLYGLFRLSRRPPLLGTAPPLCLLRPCEGDEPGLYANLLSSLRAAYGGPRRVLFLVPDAADPAFAVARAVVDAAAVDSRLTGISAAVLTTAPRPLDNRKVAQLLVGLAHSDEEVVVCADSDVRLEDGDLDALVSALLAEQGPRIAGAAFAAPIEVASATLWDRASAALVGGSPQSFLSLYGLSALFGGAPSMAGALCALRRSAILAIGGLENVRGCLGEDNEIARRLVAAGYRVALSRGPGRCCDSGRSAGQAIDRVARWLAVVRSQRPELMPSYPLLMAATPALVACGLVLHSPIFIGLTTAVVALRTLLSWSLRRFFGLRIGALRAFCEVFLGELLLWLGFLRAVSSRRIRWRGHAFYVERGGRLRPAFGPPSRPS